MNPSDTQGLFITFEGLEGAGKTTQAERLQEHLEREGYPVLLTREPGGTVIGESLRELLADVRFEEMDPLTEVFLFAAARRQHVEQVIRPRLQEGTVVLCDRFADATLAYQGYGRGVHLTQIREIQSMCLWGLQPDLTFYLDLEAHQSRARCRARYLGDESLADRLERSDPAFFERVREGYMDLARDESGRIRCLDAMGSLESLHQRIVELTMKEVSRRIPNPRRLSVHLDELT